MRKCPFCLNDIHPNSPHIYSCAKKHNGEITDKTEIRFKYLSYNYPELSTKENLIDVYETQLQSLVDIRLKYNIDFKSTQFLLNYFNIHIRNVSESSLKISASKYKKTCLEKYGVENISQWSQMKEQKRQTCLKHFGVDNVRKSQYFKDKYFNNNDFWIEKYGTTRKKLISEREKLYYSTLTDEEKSERAFKSFQQTHIIRKTVGYQSSKLEKRIDSILYDLKITKTTQFYLKITERKRYFYDFYLNELNLLIEVQGDYWHANPKLYKADDIIFYKKGKIYAKDVWDKDLIKKQIAINRHYNIMYIWEHDMNKLDDIELKNYLLNQIMENMQCSI